MTKQSVIYNLKKYYPHMVIAYAFLNFVFRLVHIFVPISGMITEGAAHHISRLLLMFGAFLIFIDLISDRAVLKAANRKWTYLLLIAAVISAICRYRYDFVHNITHTIRIFLDMVLVYSIPWLISRDWQKKFLLCLHSVGSLFFVPILLYMFRQFIRLEHYTTAAGAEQGWYEGRLFGITVAVFYGTSIATLLLFGSVCLLWKTKNRALKLLYLIEILIYSLYIVLSDTRTVFVGISAALFVIFMFGRAEDKLFAGRLKKLHMFLIYVLVILLFFAGVKGMRKVLMTAAYHNVESRYGSEDTYLTEALEEYGQSVDPVEALDRPKNTTFSSRRITIWKCYAAIFGDKLSNLIFGFSPYGYNRYIYEHYYDTYVVRDYMELYPDIQAEYPVYGTHNAFLHVLVTTGILGLVAVIGFILSLVSAFLMKYKKGQCSTSEVLLCSMVVMMISFEMFETYIFMCISLLSIIFWLIAGMLVNRLEKRDDEDEQFGECK